MICGIKRILQLQYAIQYLDFLIKDENGLNVTEYCMFSWSTDGVCWTNWVDYNTYQSICSQTESDFYLRILLTKGFSELLGNGCILTDYNICIDNESAFITDFCGETNLFQPYNNLDCALQLQQQLSDSIVCMFGIPIYYFRVNPKQEATDYTFKEHYLHYVEDVKQIKLIIPDGQMPSSNPKLTEFDFDWETDWETEISKTQFAKAFGDEAYPKTGDFIYIPMMKRMWDVNAAYDEKNEGLMWRSTTWKLSLVKYSDSTNIDTGNYESLIDDWTQSYEETFSEIEKNEQLRETGATPLSSPSYAATNLYNIFMEDAVRKQYSKGLITITDKTFNHRSNIIARNLYRFKSNDGMIIYQKPICGDSGTIMFILETPGITNSLSKPIIRFGEIELYIKSNENDWSIIFSGMEVKLSPFSTYLIVSKWNKSNFSCELNVYNYSHDLNIPAYKLRPEMYYFDFENPVAEHTGPYNNDYDMINPMECMTMGYPCCMTNIKYYNTFLDKKQVLLESSKYTTKHENCVINDLARPIDDGHGYVAK